MSRFTTSVRPPPAPRPKVAPHDTLCALAVAHGASSMVSAMTHPAGPQTAVQFKAGDGSLARFAAAVRLLPISPGAPKVYISGPMTGIADLNAPAFAAEAARLLALGYQVENPADVMLPDGATWADYMRADIPLLLACTHIRMLDGWTMSKGARLEHHIAISLGLEVLTDDDDLQEQK